MANGVSGVGMFFGQRVADDLWLAFFRSLVRTGQWI